MIIYIPYGTRPSNDTVATLLAEILAATATTAERRAGFWISVHWRQWREILGCRYRAAIQQAIEAGYIEANDRYSVGRFCKSYRLGKLYRRPRTQQYFPRRSRSSAARIRLDETDSVGRGLVEQFKRVQLMGKVNGWDGFCAVQIRAGTIYATRCEYGRFHSTYTGLKRATRSQLIADGQQLVEVDVANCQPLLVGHLAAQTCGPPQTHLQINERPNQTNSICRAFSTGQEIKGYIELCERGELYEHLERRCHGRLTLRDCIPDDRWHRHAKDRPLTKKDVKRQFLVMLFADTVTTRSMPLFDIVATEWPVLADYMLDAKRVCYQNLARDCQRLESRVMIDGVAGSLLTTSSIPIITIHDAILTTAAYVPVVEAAVIEQFRRLGVTPTTRVTHY